MLSHGVPGSLVGDLFRMGSMIASVTGGPACRSFSPKDEPSLGHGGC
jgi:hypothetical protein